MNKIGCPTYVINDNESLIVADNYIEGGHGLPLDSNSILEQLKFFIKSVKLWCGDNYILKNSTPQVFLPSRKARQ